MEKSETVIYFKQIIFRRESFVSCGIVSNEGERYFRLVLKENDKDIVYQLEIEDKRTAEEQLKDLFNSLIPQIT